MTLLKQTIDEANSNIPDPLAKLREIILPYQGMKIDRNLYRSFKRKVGEDQIIKNLVHQQNFDEAENYLERQNS